MSARVKLPEVTVHEHTLLIRGLRTYYDKLNDEREEIPEGGSIEDRALRKDLAADILAVKNLIDKVS